MGWLKNYFCGKGVDKVVELPQDNIKMYDAMILIAGWLKSGEASNVPSLMQITNRLSLTLSMLLVLYSIGMWS